MITSEPRLSRERLLAIAQEAFEQGAERMRQRRLAAGLPIVSGQVGEMNPIGRGLKAFLETIPWQDEDNTPRQEPPVACSVCGGARWLAQRHLPTYSPPLVRCHECKDDWKAEQRAQLAKAAGLSDRQRSKTFATFQPIKAAAAAVSAAVQWASKWAVDPDDEDARWLVLTGERGSGKTHLSLAATNLLVDNLNPVRWFHTLDLVDMARSLHGGDTNGRTGSLLMFRRELTACPALVLDEFGALSTAGTDWAVSAFMEPLIDARYREGRATLFTLKAGPDAVRSHISDSIGRRMQDAELCVVVENQAQQWDPRPTGARR